MSHDPVRVMVTIDTEEDDWAGFESRSVRTENIDHLVELQSILDEYGVRPTYFVNLAPLADDRARDVLQRIGERSSVEMATHCHPWNTPPFEGPQGVDGSMMFKLSAELNRAKLVTVTDAFQTAFERSPTSFRTGRWGFGTSVAEPLAELGYEVDSSVSPFVDWREFGGPDFSRAPFAPYRFHPSAPLAPDADGSLMEVPTTVGFTRGDQARRGALYRWIRESPLRRLKAIGVLDRLGLVRRRWLSPETSDGDDMVAVAQGVTGAGIRSLGMTFHSCTLLPGATPFVPDRASRAAFLIRIRSFLEYAVVAGWTFATVTAVARAHGASDPEQEQVSEGGVEA